MKIILNILVALIPFWRLKLFILRFFYGYVIHNDAWIGFAYCFPNRLQLGKSARIGHFSVIKGMEYLCLEEHATIGRLNWISGYIPRNYTQFYSHLPYRNSTLILCRHSAITNRHIIDCTDTIKIGEFTTIAGYGSQILTHTIDIAYARQTASPIIIGKFCFVGTASLILHGASIPDFSVIGAGSVVTKHLLEPYSFYAGVPARHIKYLDPALLYFLRSIGYIT